MGRKGDVSCRLGETRAKEPPSSLSSKTALLCSPFPYSLIQSLTHQIPTECLLSASTKISKDRCIPGLSQGVDSNQAVTTQGLQARLGQEGNRRNSEKGLLEDVLLKLRPVR